MQNPMFDNTQQVNNVQQTFRQPLPPTHARPQQRLPFQITPQMLIRQKIPQVCIWENAKHFFCTYS